MIIFVLCMFWRFVYKIPVATDDVEVLQRIAKQLLGLFNIGKLFPIIVALLKLCVPVAALENRKK